ncbi:MAG: hypothetical protein ACEQSR_14960 [Candidatus Methylacidiphilales bacterium]
MTIIKINENTEKGKNLIRILEQYKNQTDVLEFLSLEEFETVFLVNEIDEGRKTGYALEEDILKILES